MPRSPRSAIVGDVFGYRFGFGQRHVPSLFSILATLVFPSVASEIPNKGPALTGARFPNKRSSRCTQPTHYSTT